MKTLCNCGKRIPLGTKCNCNKRTRSIRETSESDKFMRGSKWKKKREQILKRDGGHCQRCLLKDGIIESKNMTVHHIKPRIKYKELWLEDSNLIALCRSCNSQLGTNEQLDFEWVVPTEHEFVL
ncbi:HNH endonuclease [Gottfriedia acidiceleris]|uniref:HNH endonuclease n=1 Tax=Gottfriedia acidiceleris TaxID=371036 RepID=UPI002FFE57CD